MAMKDSPFWPFGPEHPDDVPYVMALCRCAYCLEQKRFPDRAAVWDWDGFKRELLKQHPHTKVDVAAKPADHFMGFPIIVDATLPPGTVELRSGTDVVRIINLSTV